MPLHHRNGQKVEGSKEWGEEQLRLIRQWNLLEYEQGLDENGKARVWIPLFAKFARQICDDENVDIETFEALFEDFENRVIPDIETLKNIMSEHAGHYIGLEETCRFIHGRIDKIMHSEHPYLQFDMIFPHIGENGGDLLRSLRLPIL